MKASLAVPHGGGKRMDISDPEYKLLRQWIATSMPWRSGTAVPLTGLKLLPKANRLAKRTTIQLKAIAVYSDGSERDVSRLTRFRSSNTGVAAVDEYGKVETADRTGQATIVALYQGEAVTSSVVLPGRPLSKEQARVLAEFPVDNFIDQHIVDKLKSLNVTPAKITSDGSFLRRATLQIAGRLPTLEETRQFLSDDDSERRLNLVNRLLKLGDYADRFAQKWCDVLRIKRRGQKDRIAGTTSFHRWVRNALAVNKPYDEFVREIVAASGNVSVNPTAQWYAEVRYLDRYVDDTAQVFLGVRIGCARCHHHPFEKISQDDYYGMAAFFGRVDRKGGSGVAERRANETIFVKPRGSVRHSATGEIAQSKGLGSKPVDIPDYEDPRHRLVDWMTDPDNPYFAAAFVNRLWAHFFGRGLVEPMDDMRVTNPPSNEPLLKKLSDAFVRSGFDMKHIVWLICSSATYQMSSMHDKVDETQNHSRFYPQRISAEVLLDCVDSVTGVPTAYGGLPAGTRAIQLPDEGYSNDFLKVFGRPPRESACECERRAEPSLSQSLLMLNNSVFLGKVMSQKGYAAKIASDERELAERVRDLFLTALIREPSQYELKESLQYIASEPDQRTAFGNLLWALINTKDFLYIH